MLILGLIMLMWGAGANSYIDYSGNSSKPIDSISIDYDAYNVSGVIQFSDYEQRPNTGGFLLETPVGVLEKSTSIFDFKNNGYEWKPTQRIYNCAFGSASVSQMPQKYKNIADKNSLGKVKSIIENDYANDIKSFTVNNRPLNIDDFKLDKTIKKQGFDFEDGTMKYHNTIKTNYSFVSISTSESVKRDGKLYNIKAYILVIDTKNHNDEVNTSLYIEPVKK